MTSHLNGAPPPEPAEIVAETVWTGLMDEEDRAWADLLDDEREGLIEHARCHIAAHLAVLTGMGARVIPPDVVLKPTNETEAMAMLKAAKDFFDGQKRKGQLMGGVVPRKLIVPGAH